MIPKKIYLNYVNEDDKEKTWSEEPVSVNDCDMQNREYTDLSQVWHDASEEPMDRKRSIVLYGTNPVGVTSCSYEDILSVYGETWYAYVILSNISLWAYLDELLPKGGKE